MVNGYLASVPGVERPFCLYCLIDGKPILDPDEEGDISGADLDSSESGRDESGYMHRQRLREDVRTRGFVYKKLNHAEYQYMESLFRGKPEFKFEYWDPAGKKTEYTAYRSKHSIVLRNHRTGVYQNYKFNIIEC